MGRYLNTDPIGIVGGVNLYSYALQNPLVRLDPLGLDAFLIFNRCGDTGTLTIVTKDLIKEYPAYDAGPGPGDFPYGKGNQVRPGFYQVTQRPLSARGRHPYHPTLSDQTGSWNEIGIGQNGVDNERSGVQLHYGEGPNWSAGCIVSPDFVEIWTIIQPEFDNGGVTLLIVDTCERPQCQSGT